MLDTTIRFMFHTFLVMFDIRKSEFAEGGST
jgi:hypothetical protein